MSNYFIIVLLIYLKMRTNLNVPLTWEPRNTQLSWYAERIEEDLNNERVWWWTLVLKLSFHLKTKKFIVVGSTEYTSSLE
jgi:hypothetical protein